MRGRRPEVRIVPRKPRKRDWSAVPLALLTGRKTHAGSPRGEAFRGERTVARRIKHITEERTDDLGVVLHDEVNRLPEKYRAAVVLCYLEGLTHEQAADRLRWPVGTVRSRLSWARQRLRMRLTRRRLAPAVALAALELSRSALAVPEGLTECTVQSGLQLAAGQVPQAAVSAPAWFLTQGVIRTMILARWKANAAVLMTMGIAVAGAEVRTRRSSFKNGSRRRSATIRTSPRSLRRSISLTKELRSPTTADIRNRTHRWFTCIASWTT
jgi:hypothetical protein